MGKWENRLFPALFLLSLLELKIFKQFLIAWKGGQFLTSFALGLLSLAPVVIGSVCIDILTKHPARSHTLQSLLQQYYTENIKKRNTARKLRKLLESKAKDCIQPQNETLMDILSSQADTEYGRKWKLSEIKSREEFVKRHPLTTYSHFSDYIDRIANGEQNVLTKEKVLCLGLSSGTTGKSKMIPLTSADSSFMTYILDHRIYLHEEIFQKLGLKRIFQFRLIHPIRASSAGIKMCGIFVFSLRSYGYYIVPDPGKHVHRTDGAFYVQGLFALNEPELGLIEGFSSDLMLAFFKYIDENWEKLCLGIETGIIDPHPDIPEDVLKSLQKDMKPNPKRAAFLRKLSNISTVGKCKEIWPSLGVVYVCKTGSFAHVAQILLETYLKGVLIYYNIHAGTEAGVGIMIEDDPTEDVYTMLSHGPYFLEFIPIENADDEDPPCFFMDQLAQGKTYEVVITNKRGFYRFRPGDIIKIVGFRGNTPKYEFAYRAGQILNISYDRTPETQVFKAMKLSEARWGSGAKVAEYTTSESFNVERATGVNLGKGKYIMFVEIDGDTKLTDEQKRQFDENLSKVHETYCEFRDHGTIDPAIIIQVKSGSFVQVREILMGDRHTDQFKMPRVMRNHKVLKYLWSNDIQMK